MYVQTTSGPLRLFLRFFIPGKDRVATAIAVAQHLFIYIIYVTCSWMKSDNERINVRKNPPPETNKIGSKSRSKLRDITMPELCPVFGRLAPPDGGMMEPFDL